VRHQLRRLRGKAVQHRYDLPDTDTGAVQYTIILYMLPPTLGDGDIMLTGRPNGRPSAVRPYVI